MNSGSVVKAIYIDEDTSTLETKQVKTINNILFNQYRRFQQASKVEQLDEPKVLSSGSNYSSRLYDLRDMSYDGYHMISGILSLKDAIVGDSIVIMELSTAPSGNIGSAGADAEEYADYQLPGYFYYDNQTNELKFYVSVNTGDSTTYRFSAYWR